MRRIYFIKPIGMDGPIKIGCSSVPEQRLIALSVWSPYPLEVIATAPGTFKLETKLHESFADAHSHREWFRAIPRLLDALEKIKSGVPLEEAVDFEKRGSIRGVTRRRRTPEQRLRMKYVHGLRGAEKRAENQTSCSMCTPEDVDAILGRWGGFWQQEPQRPTPAEFARMDEVIADPIHHLIPHPIKYPSREESAAKRYRAAWQRSQRKAA